MVGGTGSVHHLDPTAEVEIISIDPTVEAKEVAEAVRSCLKMAPTLK